MRKLICSFAAALMVGFSAMADEGMWMLPLLQKLNADAMKDLGCRLTPDRSTVSTILRSRTLSSSSAEAAPVR